MYYCARVFRILFIKVEVVVNMFDERLREGKALGPSPSYCFLAGAIALLIVVCTAYWYNVADRKLVIIVAALFSLIPAALFIVTARNLLITERRRLFSYGMALGFSCLLFAVIFPIVLLGSVRALRQMEEGEVKEKVFL